MYDFERGFITGLLCGLIPLVAGLLVGLVKWLW